MSPTLKQMGIDRLSMEERVALAQEILDTVIADQSPGPLSAAKRQELQRRLADQTANPSAGIPWEQIEAEALTRFRQ